MTYYYYKDMLNIKYYYFLKADIKKAIKEILQSKGITPPIFKGTKEEYKESHNKEGLFLLGLDIEEQRNLEPKIKETISFKKRSL